MRNPGCHKQLHTTTMTGDVLLRSKMVMTWGWFMTFDLPQRKSVWEPQDLGMRSLEDTKTTLTFRISEEQLLILADEVNGSSQYYLVN